MQMHWMQQPLQLASLGVDGGRLPLAHCGPCGRETLAWLDVDDAGLEHLRCTGCGTGVDERRLREAGERTVERLGYAFIDRKPRGGASSRASSKLSGCGTRGVRSCGSGGCSSGSCGSGGSGGCGGGCGG